MRGRMSVLQGEEERGRKSHIRRPQPMPIQQFEM